MPSPDTVTAAALEQHGSFVLALARSLTSCEHEAQDLAQDTWLVAMRARPEVRDGLKPWLARVVRSTARTHRRGFARRRAREARAAKGELHQRTGEVIARELELQHSVVQAVLSLDEPFKSTVLLRYYDTLTVAEVARELDVPRETVRSRLRRAHEKLRERLDRDWGTRKAWAGALSAGAAALAPRSIGATAASLALPAAALVGLWLGWLAFTNSRAGASEQEELVLGPPTLAAGAAWIEDTEKATAPRQDALPAETRREQAGPQRSPGQLAYWQAVREAREQRVPFDIRRHQIAGDRIALAQAEERTVTGFELDEEESLTEVAAALREAAGTPILVTRDAELACLDEGVTFTLLLLRKHSVADVLDLIVRLADCGLAWTAEQGSLIVGTLAELPRGTMPIEFEHDVTDLLIDPADFLAEDEECYPLFTPLSLDDLIAMIQDETAREGKWFAGNDASIEDRRPHVLVRNTPRVHEAIEELLAVLRRFYAPLPEELGRPGIDLLHPEVPRFLEKQHDALLERKLKVRGRGLEGVVEEIRHRAKFDVVLTSRAMHAAPEFQKIRQRALAPSLTELCAQVPNLAWSLDRTTLWFHRPEEGTGHGKHLALLDLRPFLAPDGGVARIDARYARKDLARFLDELPEEASAAILDRESRTFRLTADSFETLIRSGIGVESWDTDPANSLRISEQRVMTLHQSLDVLWRIEWLVNELRELAGRAGFETR